MPKLSIITIHQAGSPFPKVGRPQDKTEDVEGIIVDNSGNDDEWARLRAWCSKDQQLSAVRCGGLCSFADCLNNGLALTRGEWISLSLGYRFPPGENDPLPFLLAPRWAVLAAGGVYPDPNPLQVLRERLTTMGVTTYSSMVGVDLDTLALHCEQSSEPPLRILCLISDIAPNGGQKVALETALRLRDNGHQVDVAALWDYDRGNDPAWAKRGFQVGYLPTIAELTERLSQADRYDVVLAHTWPSGLDAFLPLSRIPLFAVHHSCVVHLVNEAPGVPVLNGVVAPIDRLNIIHEIGRPMPPYVHVPNGINRREIFPWACKDRYEVRADLGVNEKHVVLMIGRADLEKGADIGAEVFARLHADMGDAVQTVAIGMGPGQHLYGEMTKLFSAAKTRLLGGLYHHQVLEWIRAADVVLVPSRQESWSIVSMEAWALGVPVVGTFKSTPPISHAGFIKCGGSAEDLAAACKRTFIAPPIVPAFDEQWDWDAITKRYDAILRGLALQGQKAPQDGG